MPEMRIMKRTRRTQRQGKAPMNVMGELTAIGIAKGRRSGPKRATAKSRVTVEREVKRAKKPRRVAQRRVTAAIALKRAGRKAAAPRVLSQSARRASAKRKGTRRASAAARTRARKANGSRAKSMR